MDSIDQGEGSRRGMDFLQGEGGRHQSEHMEGVRHSEGPLRGRGERRNKESQLAELWNGLRSFGTKFRGARTIAGVCQVPLSTAEVRAQAECVRRLCLLRREVPSYGNGVMTRRMSSKLNNRIRQDTDALGGSTVAGEMGRGLCETRRL